MVKRRRDGAALLAGATEIADAIHQQDVAVEAKAVQERIQRTSLPLARIQPRASDTRPLRPQHVIDLAESIAALGLIEPLVVDIKGILLAGGHRLAALQSLKETNQEIYTQLFPDDFIPVRMMAFEADADPERSLQVELAENEKRQNYTRDQIEQLAERLRSLDYRDTRGRPKEGEKALGPALAVAIGVSTRYVRKVLSQKGDQENRNSVPIFKQRKNLLLKMQSLLEDLAALPEPEKPTKEERELYKALPVFMKKLQASLDKSST